MVAETEEILNISPNDKIITQYFYLPTKMCTLREASCISNKGLLRSLSTEYSTLLSTLCAYFTYLYNEDSRQGETAQWGGC